MRGYNPETEESKKVANSPSFLKPVIFTILGSALAIQYLALMVVSTQLLQYFAMMFFLMSIALSSYGVRGVRRTIKYYKNIEDEMEEIKGEIIGESKEVVY